MGKTKKQPLQASSSSRRQMDDLMSTLGDFTSKENWNKFFTLRGSGDSFEWYAEWSELETSLQSVLRAESDSASVTSPRILVPGCGNSELSEHLFDAGFHDITNIDFSKVVIADMLRRNVRDRPGMRWRVMDMTAMQFADGSFDVILDKGGLDALMEPEFGTQLGSQYLSEVERVLVRGGKYVCLSLAESHVIGLLLSKVRFGWKTSIHALAPKSLCNSGLCTFMIVSEKDDPATLHPITKSFCETSLKCPRDQVAGLYQSLENENRIRLDMGSELLCSFHDLQLGGTDDLRELSPGRRFQLALGGNSNSCFRYKAILLDATEKCGPFSYHFGVFIVPKARAREWLFSSDEGQWLVVESSKASRLIMVILDSTHSVANIDEIKNDLSPLVKKFTPRIANGAQIPFLMASDGVKTRKVVYETESRSSGALVIEDVIYENPDSTISGIFNSDDYVFRRLVFRRTENLVQSEAIMVKDDHSFDNSGAEHKKQRKTSKSNRRSNRKMISESFNSLRVCHNYLASSYHMGIVSGFSLVAPHMQKIVSVGQAVNVMVIGLGAGLLPMFLRQCMPCFHIEVVELDRELVALATKYFSFEENEHLKVHIADGIEYVHKLKSSFVTNESHEENVKKMCDASGNRGVVDILIVDVDSSDPSAEMTCPAATFIEESFLHSVKDTLAEQGVFIVNLVTRSSNVTNHVITRIKTVFSHVFRLQLEEDLNVVLFALCSKGEETLWDASAQLVKLLNLEIAEVKQIIVDTAKNIQYLA